MKKIFLLLGLGLWSCNAPQVPAESVAVQTVRQLFVHFNAHDWEKMSKMYADSALFLDPSLGVEPVVQTHEQTLKKYKTLNEMIPDTHDSVTAIYGINPTTVAVEFVATGTLPDKSKLKLPICAIITVENGKIVKDRTYYDNE